MISIQMTKTRKGTEDGHSVKQFLAGRAYTVRDHLARLFCKDGVAKRITPEERVARQKAYECSVWYAEDVSKWVDDNWIDYLEE